MSSGDIEEYGSGSFSGEGFSVADDHILLEQDVSSGDYEEQVNLKDEFLLLTRGLRLDHV